MEHFNKLTPSEAERLAILSEECGEVIQAIGKILRHGYDSCYNNGITNREQLEIEIADILVVLDLFSDNGDVYTKNIEDRYQQKQEKIKKYLHHQDI